MKLKNILLSGLSLVLVAALAIGGTVAYLQDDDSDVNVMTLGNVSIAQHEYERATNADGSYKTKEIDGVNSYVLQNFSQAKPLLPTTEIDANGNPYNFGAGNYDPTTRVKMSQVGSQGTMDVFVNENVQDKFVTVENTGKSDAYVRTLIAFELGSLPDSAIGDVIRRNNFMTDQGVWKITDIGIVNIGGNNYFVSEYLYNGAKSLGGVHDGFLPAGETTYPSLAQVYMTSAATNEDCEKIDGNKNGTYDILVLSQAVQTAGFADAKTALDTAFGTPAAKAAEWFGGVKIPSMVTSVEDFQNAIDNAVNGDTIVLGDNIEGDVTVAQKAGVKFTINGNGKSINGTITVDGKSARYESAGVTIENVNFVGVTGETAYINLGKSNDTNTRYTNNVTVKNCTFSSTGNETAAIKSYTGGDYNLTVEGCTVNAGVHSFLQLANVEKGLTVTGCKVNSKNGINLNNTPYLNMSNCEFDTIGYCVRFGVNGATNNGNFTIADSTLKSANDDGDAVIILRGTMTGATLNIKGTTLTGTPDITGTANIVK